MKISLVTMIATFCASASAGSFFQQAAGLSTVLSDMSQSHPVPGNNPLEFCGDISEQLLEITDLSIVPNPPVKGQTLKIEATGILKGKITVGSFVEVTVKYGLITLVRQKFDLCENAGQVDLECPVDSGKKVLKKAVDLPAQIPPGTYTVSADAYTDDFQSITCISAKISFS